MRKLKIFYKTGNELHSKETEMRITFDDLKTEIYIGTAETKKLKYLVEWITKELRRRTLLGDNEELQIDDFNKYIIEFEETQKQRISNEVYNYCKMGYEAVEQEKTTWEHLIEILEESRCSECM